MLGALNIIWRKRWCLLWYLRASSLSGRGWACRSWPPRMGPLSILGSSRYSVIIGLVLYADKSQYAAGRKTPTTSVPKVYDYDNSAGTSIKKKKGIFISQDKYVHEILRKYNYTDVKFASTPTDLEKPLVQDGEMCDVDEHLYRSMIGSLMYHNRIQADYCLASLCMCKVSPWELLLTRSGYAGDYSSKKSKLEVVSFFGK
ncbi:hypothetical protein Tco_0191560 [Tanacetum coccineum]